MIGTFAGLPFFVLRDHWRRVVFYTKVLTNQGRFEQPSLGHAFVHSSNLVCIRFLIVYVFELLRYKYHIL